MRKRKKINTNSYSTYIKAIVCKRENERKVKKKLVTKRQRLKGRKQERDMYIYRERRLRKGSERKKKKIS